MRLSLSGFLFEDNYAGQSVPFDRFCAIAREAGCDAVELRRTQVNLDTPADERLALRRTVEDAGLYVSCLTARRMPASGPERDAFFLGYLRLCEAVGCRLLKVGAEAAWMRWACDRAAEHGVTLASNNHLGGRLETVAGTRRELDAIPHPGFGLLYDAFHLYLAGEDYLGCIAEFLPRIRNVLVHSARPAEEADAGHGFDAHGRRWVRAMPDAPGTQDWPAIFRELRAGGYDGLITIIENGWPAERREDIALHCARFVRDAWEAAA